MTDDDRLLSELGVAVRDAASVPESFIAAGRAAYAWRNVDAELATLADEPALAAGTRAAEPAPLRAFTFVAQEHTIDVEVADDALLGQVVPPVAGRVELRSATGTVAEAVIDELGWFAFRPPPTGLLRLYLHTTDGSPILTEWVSL